MRIDSVGTAHPTSPRSGATLFSSCQTSSVMNGIIGCSSRKQRIERVGQHALGRRPRASRPAAGPWPSRRRSCRTRPRRSRTAAWPRRQSGSARSASVTPCVTVARRRQEPAVFDGQVSCVVVSPAPPARVAFQVHQREPRGVPQLVQKLRASSNRSLTTAPRGRALSAPVLAHCVENSLPHLRAGDRGSSRFFFVWSISAWQCGHSNSHRHPHVLRFGRQVSPGRSAASRPRTCRSRRADRRRSPSTCDIVSP